MVRERRGKKSKSKDVEEAPAPVLLEVPPEPAINRFFKREKSPFEVGDRKELQVASSNAIIDKACVMDISGGAAQVAAKVDEYINLLFTDYCALDQASCGDISKEIKIVVIEEEGEPTSIQPALSVEEEEKQRQEAEEAARKAAEEEARRREQEEQRAREEAERQAREEEERIAREEAERLAAEEAERQRIEEEKKKAAEEEKRKKAEAEAKKKAEEEEKAKKEAEEKARLEAEAEAARKKAEEEAYDSDRELIPPKEDDGINWEAVEEEAPLVPDVLQELLEQRATEDEGQAAEESEKEMTERDRDLEWQRQRQMMRPPLVISHLKSRAVPLGSTAKLTCNVTGPSLSVRWLKNGNPVELKPEKYKFFNSEGLLSLEILNVTKRDAAEYTCFAKNKNGETSTIASITVYDTDVERPIPPTFITIKDRNKVEEPPKEEEEKVELDKWGDPIKKRKRKVRPLSLWAQREKLEFTVHLPATLTVIEDRNARFICGVSGGGKLDIVWYKNDKKIRFERFPRILDYTRNSTGCIGIECSQMADAGIYKCTFTDKEKGETLTTQCELIVVPRIKRTKELSRKIPPAFVRKLQYTYKPEDDQLIVHCTILANPEPTIRWYVQKVPLHLCPLPRVTVFNHPDDVHEHTIASLVILGPSYLDNGEYVIEVENEAGFERRTLNIQFQTEEEYNEKYYKRYLEHKEHFKLHEYGPGEERWEDIVPEVPDFHFYEPEPEVGAKTVSAGGKIRKRRKKHRLIKKKVMMPWGEEEEQEVTDEDASSESYSASESEKAPSEPEEEEGWGVESEPEEEEKLPVEEESKGVEPQAEVIEEQKDVEPQPENVEVIKEPEPEPEPVEEIKEPEIVEEIKEPEPAEKIKDLEPENGETVTEKEPEAETQAEILPSEKPAFKPPEFEDFEPKNRDYEPDVVRMRQEDPEFPYIWKRPKFYITDFQLRKKFYFVNKLIDVELVKGKTLRLESFAAALGKVTVEWRFNGRIIGETHRRTIEFNPHRNLTVLEIENTRVQDSGTYSVVFYNDYTEPLIDACKVNIIVPKPLESADQPPTFTRLLTDTYKEWTDELILDCHVRGIPKPTVTWYKNGNEVPTDNPRYHFEHDDDGNCTFTITNPIKNADRGRYVVKAKNHVGEDECQLRVWFRGKEDDDMHERAEYRRTQKMYKSRHVKEKDEDEWGGELYHSKRLDKQKDYDHRYKLSWLSRITAQTLAQGSTLKFVAFVDGKYPQFEWYFNDIPLVHGRKYRQIVTKNGKGCLIINNVQPMDSGIYRLVVKNYANSIDCEAKVTVYAYEHKNFDPPLFLNTLTDTYDQVTNKLIIECNIKTSLDFSNHKIKWYKDDMEIRPSYVTSSGGIPTTYEQEIDENTGRVKLIITYPMNTDCGLYRCCVHDRNSHKVDEISHLVYKIFNPPPHIPLEELEIGERRNRIVFDNYLSDIYADDTNKSIRLNCKISQCNAQSEIKWYKNNEELPIEDYREKYRFTKSYNRLCLEILHPKLNDAGTYECRVKNQYNETSTKCNVYVNEKIERQRSKATPREPSYIDFSTGIITDKEQAVEYLNEIEDSNKILLERSTREIAARIHRSTNLFDIPSSASSTATERPNFATPLSDRTVTENSSSVKFTCSLLSSECDISWEKNGIPIRPSSKFTQTFSDGLAILEIFDVSDDDAGKYTCIASNKFGDNSTSARLKVYSGFKPSVSMPPTVMRQMKESYNLHNDLLTLECRVRGTPKPHIQWMKDGDYIMPGDKYQQTELPDGTCKLIIHSPDPEEDSGTYTCEAECNGCSDSISHNVQYEGSVENQFNRVHRYYHRDPLKPYFKTGLVDTNIPSGGSIALFVESQANCEAEWYRDRWIIDHKPPKRYIFNDGNGFFACVINHATMDEAAKYSCKLSNPYGTSQSTSFIDIINPNQVGKGQKPPIFVTRPQPEIKIRAGDPFSMSFRVQGEPKPRIQWYKGARDITNAGRTIKEVFNDYVRFSIKESKENDSGIYFITARNRHGVDRSFCQVTVRERQELISGDASQLSNIDFTDVSYMKNPPGQIPNEPTVIDSSANHLSLSWMKPQCNDSAPVVGYRIDSWLVGKEGDATWKEIGTSALASFDVFNLKSGCEYHFRVTPRNRYGYGPSTQTTYPIMFGDVVKLPEFTKILPGQLKALINDDITLECVSMGSPRPEIVWYKDGIRIDSNEKHVISVMGPLCRLIIHNVTEDDNGRYTCEASNKEGRVSTFARVQTVTDPKLLEADNKLKKNIETDLEKLSVDDEILPQFTMRLRDRRVQCTYPVRLTCQVLAIPHATIEWFKEGIKLIEDDRIAFLQEDQFNTLEISRTFLEDSGQYTVTARNELGSVSCHCNLTVDKGIRAYISPEFIKPLDTICTYNEGQDIHLEAHVEAYPSVGVTWHHNGIRLRPSRKIQASLDCDGVVSLIITETTMKDAGTYTCVASNAVGRVESTCRINIVENSDKKSRVIPSIIAPDAPYSKEPLFLIRPRSSEAFEGDTVIIMCEVIGDPKPEVLWLRDFLKPEYYKDAQHFRSVIGNESEYRLEIPHAKIEYTGTYSVIASNCYGQAKAIISLQIYAKDLGRSMDAGSIIHGNIETLPRIVKHLKDLRCCDGDAVTLECHIEGTPEPNVFWEKDGKILHDRSTEHRQNFNGRKATLSIPRVFPEDEGQYCLVACNNMGRVKSSACIIVDVPEEKENLLSRQLSRPMTFLSLNSTPRSTPRSTPARSMSPFSLHLSMISNNAHLSYRQRRYRFSAPKFYSVPHNRVCEEGDTVRFQCAIAGHPIPWSTWDKDGVIVTPSQRYIIKERDDMRYLEIEEVCFEDAGLYRITLENEYGRIEATARLDIIKSSKINRRGIRASSAPNRDSRSISRRIMGYSTKIGGRMALAGQRASSIPAKKTVYHDGYDITDSERLTITENENEILLEIDNVKTYDEGEYTLMLEDEDGVIITTTTFAKVHYVDDETFGEKIPPKIKQHLSQNVSSIEGVPLDLTLYLDCKIPFDYVWFKNDEPIINSDDFIYIDHGNGILTLRVQDPFVFDSGKYTCVITTLSGECISECYVEIEEFCEINVLDVMPEFIKAPLPFISLPGCLASFCARITPIDSEVVWSICGCEISDDMKDYKIERLEDGLNVLHVLNVDHRQSGEVKCRVISRNNPKIFNVYHTRLTVLPVPISERYEPIESVLENNCNNSKSNRSSLIQDLDLSCFITKRPEDQTVLVGDSIELNVSYIGFPEPVVHWMRAERLIENQPNTIIITKNGHSRLIINNITSDQSGKYSVEIMNEHSTDIASASVAVEGVPDAPISLSYSKGTDRIAVAWSGPPYDGGCMLTGFLLEMQQDSGEWIEVAKVVDSLAYTVKNLIHDVKYRFRVRAQNVHGSSAPSKSTEEIILVKPIDMDSEEGDRMYSSVPEIKTGGDFKTRFDILEELGKGRFGTVYRVMERETRLILAAKIIKCIKAMDRKKVQDEIKIMKSLQHPKLLQLSASFETQKEIIMVMEYLCGGELFERVVADDFTLTERDCILFMRQICEGVEYMHTKYVVHLDLKPENIMCITRTSHQIKIIDFGLAQNLEPGKQVRVLFGTPEFCPPEIINYEPIGLQSDMWSLGVICYVLLSGLSPFMGENDVDTFSNITRAYYDFDDEAFDAITEEAKDFIAGLLVYRKENRMTAKNCLESKWLSQEYDVMGSIKLCTDKLKKFIIRRKWQKTGNAIRAIGKMKNLTLSAASRKSASGVFGSPRPSLSGPTFTNNNNNNNNNNSSSDNNHSFVSDNRITSVDEEFEDDSNNLLSANDKLKDPRVCNERSDSGFSECSNCSTPSASCLCNLTAHVQDTIIEEHSNSTSSGSSIEPHETTESTQHLNDTGEEIHTMSSDHDIRSEISSLEYDEANKTNCDNNEDIIDISIRVPTRRELFQNDDGDLMSEIERRKISLENIVTKKSTHSKVREEFSLEKLKKTNKVAKLMEKFQIPEESTNVMSSHINLPNYKFKLSVTNEKGLKCITTPDNYNTNPPPTAMPITNSVYMCDLPKQDSINAGHDNNHNLPSDSLIAKSPPSSPTTANPASLSFSSATRKSPSSSSTNPTTTFRLSDRVREATERLSKPKQQAVTMTTDKTTKASILKQNANFVRSKEFWRR